MKKEDDLGPLLTETDFQFFKEKIFALAGIHLSDKKKDLVFSRIRSYLRKKNIRTFSEYRQLLQTCENNSPEIQNFINLMTTNKTEFFREVKHFDFLIKELIPFWISNGKKEIKIWVCATSTGEEPYTLSMILDHYLPANMSFSVLATDIDTQVLSFAKNGVYPLGKLNEIPPLFQSKYLTLGQGKVEGWFRVKNSIHSKIQFKQHNLVTPAYPGDQLFDLILCRNVLIYFSPQNVRELMHKLHKSLKADGTLFIGHSESLHGTNNIFKSIRPAVYKKVV